MQRPGPLRDIPLDRINLADNHSHHPSFKQRPNKRPLSPNASPVCSPAKRQMTWTETGLSAEKSSQAPAWSSTTRGNTAARAQMAPPPMMLTPRKLDFGFAKSEAGDPAAPLGTSRAPDDNRLPSSLLDPDAMDVDDYSHSSLPAMSHAQEEPVTPIDPRWSEHYPGFEVFVDGEDGVVLPSSPRKSSAVGVTPKKAKEADKENLPPRMKVSKASKGSENIPEGVEAKMDYQLLVHCADAALNNSSSLSASTLQPSPAINGGSDYTMKSRLDAHDIASRGHILPWLTPGHATHEEALLAGFMGEEEKDEDVEIEVL